MILHGNRISPAEFHANAEAAAAWLITNTRRQCGCQHPSARPGKRVVWECTECGNLAFSAPAPPYRGRRG